MAAASSVKALRMQDSPQIFLCTKETAHYKDVGQLTHYFVHGGKSSYVTRTLRERSDTKDRLVRLALLQVCSLVLVFFINPIGASEFFVRLPRDR